MISSYWSPEYDIALNGWRLETFHATTRGGRVATECVWLNFPPPLELHDYRYLGRGYRERERIRRKQRRWRAKLQAMPPIERYAMLSVLEDVLAEGEFSSLRCGR
jgi:DNA adenine methylase